MLTQQQIEQLLQASSKHRSASKEEIALLQQALPTYLPNVQAIKNVKVISEHSNKLSFSFEEDKKSALNDQYFITLPK